MLKIKYKGKPSTVLRISVNTFRGPLFKNSVNKLSNLCVGMYTSSNYIEFVRAWWLRWLYLNEKYGVKVTEWMKKPNASSNHWYSLKAWWPHSCPRIQNPIRKLPREPCEECDLSREKQYVIWCKIVKGIDYDEITNEWGQRANKWMFETVWWNSFL